MIYTIPWAPVIALSVVLLLLMVVPLVAFAALAAIVVMLVVVAVGALLAAAVTIPVLGVAAIRRLPRPSVPRFRLRIGAGQAVTSGDARLDRVR
jgi:hypothetical protein